MGSLLKGLGGGGIMSILDPVGALLHGSQKAAAPAAAAPPAELPPTLLTPTEMPSPTSSEVRSAKRRSYADQLSRKGRESTILSGNDTLGAA